MLCHFVIIYVEFVSTALRHATNTTVDYFKNPQVKVIVMVTLDMLLCLDFHTTLINKHFGYLELFTL